jgi:hypothetical protein
MKKVKKLDGYTTWIVAGVIILLGILQGFGIFTVPAELYIVLGGSAAFRVRSAINKVAEQTADKVKGLGQ